MLILTTFKNCKQIAITSSDILEDPVLGQKVHLAGGGGGVIKIQI
jgi:hypothetical protein